MIDCVREADTGMPNSIPTEVRGLQFEAGMNMIHCVSCYTLNKGDRRLKYENVKKSPGLFLTKKTLDEPEPSQQLTHFNGLPFSL